MKLEWRHSYCDVRAMAQYGFFFLWSTIHPVHQDVRWCTDALCGDFFNLSIVLSISAVFQTNAILIKFLVHHVNKGLVPIHYKYFIRNLIFHNFLLSPVAWNMRVSINLTSYASSKPDSVAIFSSGIKSRNGKK